MADEERELLNQPEKVSSQANESIIQGVADEFLSEQQALADLDEKTRAEMSRATLTRSITQGALSRGKLDSIESPVPQQEAGALVKQVAFSESLAYEKLSQLLADGSVNAENIETEVEQIMSESQGKIRGFFSKFRKFFPGGRQEEEDRRSREAFSFVTTELVKIMTEIFEQMDFSSEEESAFWKKVRLSVSTTTLLPLTLLQVVRNIPIVESFRYLQDTFWLRRISRVGVVDRHGKLEKGRQPVDETLQSDGSSHTSLAVHSPETRKRFTTLEQSEQLALRLFASLSMYGQKSRAEEFKLYEQVNSEIRVHTVEVGFRTKERFYKMIFTAEDITEARSSSEKIAQCIASLAVTIDAIQNAENGRIEIDIPGSNPKFVESMALSVEAQQVLQNHAYRGRHRLSRVDEAFLDADICLLLDAETAQDENLQLAQRPDFITGGSHMKEVILPLVDAEGNVVADANKFSHTWWQGNNGRNKQEADLKVVDLLSRVYVSEKKKADGQIDTSEWRLSQRLHGVKREDIDSQVADLKDAEERSEWFNALRSEKEKVVRIPPEWVAQHTISFETLENWNERVTKIREKWKEEDLRFSVADLLNFATLLAGDVPSIYGVTSRETTFEGRKTEVLGVLHVTKLKQEFYTAFQEFLRSGQALPVDAKSLRKKLEQYKKIKQRGRDGNSWASFFGTLTGGSVAGKDLSDIVAGISRTGVMVGENVVNAIQGEHGLLSVLDIPRDVQAFLKNVVAGKQYSFLSANTSSYRPENIEEQDTSTFLGGLGVAPGGGWKNGEFEMQGLRITQRLLPDQAFSVLRDFVKSSQRFVGFHDEILFALENSIRVSHKREDGSEHTYNPDAFLAQLLSQNVPDATGVVSAMNNYMEKQYMPALMRRIELAMNWLLSILEAE